MNLYPNNRKTKIRRGRATAHDPVHTILSVKYGGMYCYGMGIYGYQWKQVSSVYWWCNCAIYSAQIQPNTAKLIRQCSTEQMINDPKYTARATREFPKAKKWDLSQSLVLKPTLEIKLDADKQADAEAGCSKCLVEHLKGWNTAFVDEFQTGTTAKYFHPSVENNLYT